jgi:hypothetical protein
MKAENVVASFFIGAIVALLFASPFLIAWGLWSLIAPVTVLERVVALVVILIVAGAEGFVAWFLGLVLVKVAADW